MATALIASSKPYKEPEEKKPPFQEYEVSDALYTLTSFERQRARVDAIRANKALMKAVGQLAKKRLAEKQAEDRALKALAGVS